MISILTPTRRSIQSIIFVQAVLHESSLLKENLTALKEEAEVDFFFYHVYIFKDICEGER